jgi:hypothetical protein
MKKILLLLAICSPTVFLSSQTVKKSTYLVVRIDYRYDKPAEKPFFKITAETGNPFANEVYSLIEYNTDKKAINSGGTFFSNRTDTTKVFYNYFNNLTEALLFLSQNNWKLITIYNQITSSYNTERVKGDLFPYTTVSSYPVYFFEKNIE